MRSPRGGMLAALARLAAGVLCAACAHAVAAAPLPERDALELKVKAALIYNFARFTTWPADKLGAPEAPVEFCVRANAPLTEVLTAALAGKQIAGRRVVVRAVAAHEDLRDCHVAWVGDAARERLAGPLGAIAGSGVLSVYEGDVREDGGAIRLFQEHDTMQFEIDVGVAERERLELSSRLLGVARAVQR